MEGNQELKHICKFCNKSFPCGRSLGGHVRSHLNNFSTEASDEKISKTNVHETKAGIGYELRENPKKSWRVEDSVEKNSTHSRICKYCGKTYPSWKALFGHMKCHSDKEKVSKNLEDQDSCNAGKQKMVVQDIQSENEAATPNRKRRSVRRTRCLIETSNSFSLSSVNSESDQEEEEEEELVALSLIMLSRDVRSWNGWSTFAESSVKNSVHTSGEVVKSRKVFARNSGYGGSISESVRSEGEQSEISAARNLRKGSRTVKVELSVEQGKNLVLEIKSREAQLGPFKYDSRKRRLEDATDNTLKLDSAKSVVADVSDAVIGSMSNKRSKFECFICNKIFHSYQALGGHKASHRKLKGCLSSKIEVGKKSSEVQVSPDLAADSKLVELSNYEHPTDNPVATVSEENAETSSGHKNSGAHMCPVCLKVFPSGQALGGHKRAHLLEGSKAKNTQQGIEIQNQVQETREFLDLNHPAPAEEDANTRSVFKPWWMDNNQQHEPLLNLILN